VQLFFQPGPELGERRRPQWQLSGLAREWNPSDAALATKSYDEAEAEPISHPYDEAWAGSERKTGAEAVRPLEARPDPRAVSVAPCLAGLEPGSVPRE